MLRTLLAVLTLSQLTACVADAEREVNPQNTNVVMVGTFRSNGGSTDIYFGNNEAPLATTSDRGSYRIEIPRATLDESSDRRLYFYSSLGEAGTSPEIKEFDSGEKTIDTVFLAPAVEMKGAVSIFENGVPTPANGATIKVGRAVAQTDAQGRYSILLPQNSFLPVELQKKGFVITRATWQTSDISEERPFTLYTKLDPEGRVTLPVRQRLMDTPKTRVPLYIESTPSARYVRVSTSPFTVSPDLDSTWFSTKEAVTIKASDLSQDVLYYQFADENKKALSPVNTLPLASQPPVVTE
ncbi:MAG: hypothetical protein V4655_00710 [Bdellovibrionota bacterium]